MNLSMLLILKISLNVQNKNKYISNNNMKWMICQVIHDQTIDKSEFILLLEELKEAVPITFSTIKKIEIDPEEFDLSRNQINGQELLNYYISTEREKFVFITNFDLYVPSRNFVFGLAVKNAGCIISFNRLHSHAMIYKETLHEIGHLLGLSHCNNNCIMQYSNSYTEALAKPAKFCDTCELQLTQLIKT